MQCCRLPNGSLSSKVDTKGCQAHGGARFGARRRLVNSSLREIDRVMNKPLFLCVGLLSVSAICSTARELRAQCCDTAYRLICQTVYEERQVTCYRQECETVYDTQEVARQVPVWETEQRERRYKVLK